MRAYGVKNIDRGMVQTACVRGEKKRRASAKHARQQAAHEAGVQDAALEELLQLVPFCLHELDLFGYNPE